MNAVRIIGIDPGSRYTGGGIVDRFGNSLKHVFSTTIVTIKKKALEERLVIIFDQLNEILKEFSPEKAAIERVFHSVNPKSSLVLGHARGVALLALSKQGLNIREFAPNEIKSAVVGVGRADKSQVMAMVKILLNLGNQADLKEDESDALAAAICYANTTQYTGNQTHKRSF